MPSIIPACVIAGAVIVGGIDMLGDEPAAGSIAFANPKSRTFTVPSVRHLDVRGLEIPVDNPLFVRGFKCLGDLSHDGQRFLERDRAAGDPLRKIVALDEFHDERADPSAFFEAMDVRDVRVIQ